MKIILMNLASMIMKKTILEAICIGSVIVVIAFGCLVYAHLINKPAVNAFRMQPVTVALPIPSTTSTELKMAEGSSTEEAMNTYWLSRINELRQQKKLEPIAFDARLAYTAKIWAVHMGTTGILSHDRPNGERVSEWIKTYNLPFTTPAPGSGYKNTFTENIGRAYADTSTQSLQKGLDHVLATMINEGPEGSHYRTIFSSDWNRYGGGFYFEPISKGHVRVYMAFHYAHLQ